MASCELQYTSPVLDQVRALPKYSYYRNIEITLRLLDRGLARSKAMVRAAVLLFEGEHLGNEYNSDHR